MNTIKGDECFKILDNNQYILFYFTASWCGPCQEIYPHLVELIKTLDQTKIIVYKIDIDEDENNEICEKCQIKSVPSFLLFKNRSLVDKTTGANIESIKKMIINKCI
jgi:thioredoxin 1